MFACHTFIEHVIARFNDEISAIRVTVARSLMHKFDNTFSS